MSYDNPLKNGVLYRLFQNSRRTLTLPPMSYTVEFKNVRTQHLFKLYE